MAKALQNVLFALGPSGTFLFNAPRMWFMSNLPRDINNLFKGKIVQDVLCCAFGEQKGSYFFSYTHLSGVRTTSSVCCGDDLPKALHAWLFDDENKFRRDQKHTKVVLGPGRSFIAWDSTSIRWSKLPGDLEEALQSWLGPGGWNSGPPRAVALGHDGAYFALSQYGAYAYSIPDSSPEMARQFSDFSKLEGTSWGDVDSITFSAHEPDRFVIVLNNTRVIGQVPDNALTGFRQVSYSFASEPVAKIYDEETEQQDQAEAEAQATQFEEENREQRDAEEQMQLHYVLWHSKCDAIINSTKPIVDFPYLPNEICTCEIESCINRKTETGLLACRHDVEKLLRASGSYSRSWLRVQRINWHPDRFGRRCSHAHKLSLQKISTELYAIFEELIADEHTEGT